jgi:polyisoprenoid-binding protein YceI
MFKKYVSLGFILTLLVAVYAAGLKQYKIDKNHSNVGFAVSIMGGLSEVHGKFTDFNIELLNDEEDITKSKVKAIIKAASIDTGIDGRDQHLRTADFFDAEKYPDIVFESKRIKKNGKDLIAIGDLTMHGVTKEISLPFKIVGVADDKQERKKNIGYKAEMILNRKDFGINWQHSSVPGFVGNEIAVRINLITRVIKY